MKSFCGLSLKTKTQENEKEKCLKEEERKDDAYKLCLKLSKGINEERKKNKFIFCVIEMLSKPNSNKKYFSNF